MGEQSLRLFSVRHLGYEGIVVTMILRTFLLNVEQPHLRAKKMFLDKASKELIIDIKEPALDVYRSLGFLKISGEEKSGKIGKASRRL